MCLGAAVARLEARVALQEFLARFPRYDVDEGGVDYMHSGNVQGPTRGAGHRPLDGRFRGTASLQSRLHVGVAESADALA